MQTKAFLLSLAVSKRATLLALAVATLVSCAERKESSNLVQEEQPTRLLAEVVSDRQLFWIKLELADDDSVPLGRYHNWLVTLSNAKKEGIFPATIALTGGMPNHGHGLPTSPDVASHLGGGVYRVEGLKFHMAGEWIMRFNIATERLQDHAEFTLNVTP